MSALRPVFVALILLSPLAIGDDDGDAGTERDASDSSGYPTQLPAWSSYSGALDDAQDPDWYSRADFGDGVACVAATVAGPTAARVTWGALDVDRSSYSWRTASALKYEGQAVRLGIVHHDVDVARLGLESGVGGYDFTLTRFDRADLGVGDASTGADAGSVAWQATPVAEPCIGGTLRTATDVRDVLAVEGFAGESLAVSFQALSAPAAVVEIVAVDGTVLASGYESLQALLPMDGTYYVVVGYEASQGRIYEPPPVAMPLASGVQTDYIVGLVVLDPRPPGSGCRPACAT